MMYISQTIIVWADQWSLFVLLLLLLLLLLIAIGTETILWSQ